MDVNVVAQQMADLRMRLAKDNWDIRKRNISLLISADCDNNCFDTFLQDGTLNGALCDKCRRKIDKELGEYNENAKFKEAVSKLEILFNQKGIFRGGTRFILNVPPKSFRNLRKKKRRLAYKEIIKHAMKRTHLEMFKKNDELLLYLAVQIKENYDRVDCDNISKTMCDALENIVYPNDNQIKILICEKIPVSARISEGFVIAIDKIRNNEARV